MFIFVRMHDMTSFMAQMDQGQTVEYVRAYLHEHFGVPFTGSVRLSPHSLECEPAL
jgi:hypothetical protein